MNATRKRFTSISPRVASALDFLGLCKSESDVCSFLVRAIVQYIFNRYFWRLSSHAPLPSSLPSDVERSASRRQPDQHSLVFPSLSTSSPVSTQDFSLGTSASEHTSSARTPANHRPQASALRSPLPFRWSLKARLCLFANHCSILLDKLQDIVFDTSDISRASHLVSVMDAALPSMSIALGLDTRCSG